MAPPCAARDEEVDERLTDVVGGARWFEPSRTSVRMPARCDRWVFSRTERSALHPSVSRPQRFELIVRTMHVGDVVREIVEMDPREAQHAVPVGGRLVVAPLVLVEVVHARVPPAAVGLDDQTVGREEHIDPPWARRPPRQRRLTHDRTGAGYTVEHPAASSASSSLSGGVQPSWSRSWTSGRMRGSPGRRLPFVDSAAVRRGRRRRGARQQGVVHRPLEPPGRGPRRQIEQRLGDRRDAEAVDHGELGPGVTVQRGEGMGAVRVDGNDAARRVPA